MQTAAGFMHPQCAAGYGAGMAPTYGQPPPAWAPVPQEEDRLAGWWLFLIYGTIVLPCIWLPVAILRLVLYYQWQTTYPMRAAELRKHGRIAAAIFLAIWGTLWLISKLM
jgi:hypothetical protein